MSRQLLIFWLLNYLPSGIIFSSIPVLRLAGWKNLSRRALFSLSLAWFIGQFIKIFFYFPRPFILSRHLPRFAAPLDATFPSLHAATAFAVALTILRFRPGWGIGLCFLAVLVSFARYFYGLHTPVDLLAGFCIALVVAQIDTCHS